MEALTNLFNQTVIDGTSITFISACATLFSAIIFGLIISVTYMITTNEVVPNRNFVMSLVLIPAVMGLVILLVGNNLVRVFSLAGTVSLIRYRSVPGDPKDIAYILLCAAAGLAAGIGFYLYGALGVVLLCVLMILLNKFNFASSFEAQKILKVTSPEDLDYQGLLDDLFKEYTTASVMSRVRTTDLGSLYEVMYSIKMKKDVNEKDFIDAVRCRNGNLTVTLALAPTEYGA